MNVITASGCEFPRMGEYLGEVIVIHNARVEGLIIERGDVGRSWIEMVEFEAVTLFHPGLSGPDAYRELEKMVKT